MNQYKNTKVRCICMIWHLVSLWSCINKKELNRNSTIRNWSKISAQGLPQALFAYVCNGNSFDGLVDTPNFNMADFENPFTEDNQLKNNDNSILSEEDDDVVDDENSTKVRNTRTIDAFLGAVHEFLEAADQRYYVRMREKGKKPDHRIHKKLEDFTNQVFNKPDAIRHAVGQVAIEGFHDIVSPFYDSIAAGDVDSISQIDHDLLTTSGIKDRWMRAGPNVKAKFITYFQAMVRFSNIYYLNISVDENVGTDTVNKFKNSDAMNNVMEQMGSVMSKFSAKEKQGLIDFVRNPNVLKSAVTALFSGNLNLGGLSK